MNIPGDNDKVTIVDALIALEVPVEHRTAGARLRHALEAIITRQPKRFERQYGPGDKRVRVRFGAVRAWLLHYRPHVEREANAGYIQIYLRDEDYQERLERLAHSVGRPSLSAAINDWVEGGLEMVIVED